MLLLEDRPNKRKLDIKKYNLSKREIYYVSFFYEGQLHSRPIQLIGNAWTIYDKNYSKIIREETNWKYIYKEYSILKNAKIEREVRYKDDSGYGFDDLRISLIGKTQDESKIRFILFNLEAQYLSEWERILMKSELEYFESIKPTLVKYVKTFDIKPRGGGFYNLEKYFIKNKKDILNQCFFEDLD